MKLFILRSTSSKNFFISLVMIMSCAAAGAQQMTITPGTSLVLNGTVSLVLNNAALTNNGAFAAGASTVNFSGHNDTLVSYVSGNSATVFNNLSVSKSAYGLALKSVVAVKNVLAVSAGNLYTDSNLTLLSSQSLTAMVDVVSSGSRIIGKTMVERYIPARRAWRLMTAPVTNANTIYSSWQNNGVYTSGKGMLVTGPNPTAADGNGLDYSAQNLSSLKGFNYSTQSFTKVINTKVPASQGNVGSADNTGYFVFIRGDRNPSNTNLGIDNITTITSIGNLQTGTQTFAAASAYGAYTLIGNPYASPVSFDNIARTNVIKRFYVWDPSLNMVGGYVMLDDLDNDGVYSKSVAGSAQTKDIQSSQAFFVQTNAAGAASVTFNESSKSTNNNSLVFRPVAGTISGKIIATLNLLNADSTVTLADGTFAEFNDNYSAGLDLNDAAKFSNTNENISVAKGNVLLAAERRPAPGLKDTVYFRLGNTTQRAYQLILTANGLQQPNLKAYLEDSYLGTSTEISLSGSTTAAFTINGEAASASANRFRIVFKPATRTLPVTISSVQAYRKSSTNTVQWKVENELNMVKYDVEKSADGVAFKHVNTTNVTGDNNSYNTYSWIDVNAVEGNNIYRIKAYDRSGEIKYSNIVNVAKKSAAASGFSIFPNPVTGNVINLVMTSQPAGKYQVKLTNITGQVIFVKTIRVSGGNSTESLHAGTTLIAGIYQLEITGPDNSRNTQKVIVE